jgi:hypothetical protein
MDYFLVLSIFIFVFTFLFYVQYVNRENKYNSTDKDLQTQTVEAKKLTDQLEQQNTENASQIETNYNKAYDELSKFVDGVSSYTTYVNDIYDARIPGVTINGFTMNVTDSKINLSLHFDTATYSTEIIFKYRTALLEYDWVPKGGIDLQEGDDQIWEVKVDGTTTKE